MEISNDVVEKLKYLVKKDIILRDYYDEINISMDNNIFDIIINGIIKNCNNSIKTYDSEILGEEIIEQYKEVLKEDSIKLINCAYQMDKKIYHYHLIKDLATAKEDTIINMKYFMSEAEISSFDELYTNAMRTQDVDAMQKLLGGVQDKILEEWSNYFKDLDTMTDDNFCFLGHSSRTDEYSDEFNTRYVSCSLYNQDVNDTFNNDFGFIMAPLNIVAASSSDMNVDNEAIEDDDLLFYSSIKKIDHPKRLLDECLKLREENLKNNKNLPVCNEVVSDGFYPTAIFCFTNGSKNFDYNYERAYKLQKSFPNLKVYSFDVMKHKKGYELENFKLELIDSLLEELTNYNNCYSTDLFRYDYFFEKFTELKKKDNYTESDIELIFRKNIDMITFASSDESLFNGDYFTDEIKYILGKSYKYNIDSIFSKDISLFTISELASLLPYKDKLNNYYDGLSELVEIVSKVNVTYSMIEEIKSKNPTNLYTISKYLTKQYVNCLNHEKVDLPKDRVEESELLKEKEYREKKVLS